MIENLDLTLAYQLGVPQLSPSLFTQHFGLSWRFYLKHVAHYSCIFNIWVFSPTLATHKPLWMRIFWKLVSWKWSLYKQLSLIFLQIYLWITNNVDRNMQWYYKYSRLITKSISNSPKLNFLFNALIFHYSFIIFVYSSFEFLLQHLPHIILSE